jgi:hypothetical protein
VRLAIAMLALLLLGAECEPSPAACVAPTMMRPEWCVRTCEGRSFEFLLDVRFGERCGDCRCFDTPE